MSNPLIDVEVPPKETDVLPNVTDELSNDAFGIVENDKAPEPLVNSTSLLDPSDVGKEYDSLNCTTPLVAILIRVVVFVLRFKPVELL